MMPRIYVILFVLVVTRCGNATSSKILLVPRSSYGSLFALMKKMACDLRDQGHTVTLVVSGNRYDDVINRTDTAGINVQPFTTTAGFETGRTAFTETSLAGNLGWYRLSKDLVVLAEICDDLFSDSKFLQRLRDENFDLIIACAVAPCSALLAHYLSRPFVLVSPNRLAPVSQADMYSIPNNPAYIPCLGTGLTDQMNFFERIYNLGYFFMRYVTVSDLLAKFAEVKDKHHIRPDLGIRDVYADAELFLFNADTSSSYPRPLMPNVVSLGSGYLIDSLKPLNKELEDFVQSSGDDGIVIFSFGTYVEFTSNRFRRFAMALERLPQKVVAKYDGDEQPEYLENSENVKLLKWIPQNDLLGHPKTKALIYHGGINGVQEAIHYAVPVVGIPLFMDQHDNVQFLADKGMAIVLDVGTMTSEDLYRAVTEIIEDPTYKENAEHLSRLQRDTPLSHKENFLFWIEYIIRHGGKHLKSRAVNLNFFQYYCIDVCILVFLMLSIATFVFIQMYRLCRKA